MTVGAGVAVGLVVLAVAISGCVAGPGAAASMSPGAQELGGASLPAPSAPAQAPPASPPGPSVPGPTPSPVTEPTDGPPAATLLGGSPGGPGVPGVEGSFTWGRLGSDAPWIVPDVEAQGTGPWTVVFDPPLAARRWTASWAPVRAGVADDPVTRADGPGPPIVIDPPGRAGRWSLRVEAWFGTDRHVAWFWSVRVGP
jgi:hypothetical protein